uniref:Retrotransposon gag domain-containing protein n=1 Tax=Tanacetum cinerariifolium TaxID=118510 RepID=A0A6L2K1J0_TANCI|nr:hypothetical protein [Tanacetum cinerariifolium]
MGVFTGNPHETVTRPLGTPRGLKACRAWIGGWHFITPPTIVTETATTTINTTSRIMPPKMMKIKAVKKMVKKRIAEAIEEYEKTRLNPGNASGSGVTNTGGSVNVQGCTHKTFMNRKPHPFNGMEGVVGLRRWIEKVEQVFEICKCAEEDKTEFKSMMTTTYCPVTEIQRMEEELWTLTLKGDDIEAYNNRFHELALMCLNLMPNEKKKIEKYIKGFPKIIKGNITFSRPTTLHDAINLARELVEQAVQGTYSNLVRALINPND